MDSIRSARPSATDSLGAVARVAMVVAGVSLSVGLLGQRSSAETPPDPSPTERGTPSGCTGVDSVPIDEDEFFWTQLDPATWSRC